MSPSSIGQKKPVHVYQLIAENTVESKAIYLLDCRRLASLTGRSFVLGD